ncbi:uncharacterized protein [Drosophila kikkawai]|uniref:Uncharacterized protein n=1 Tax=Drosophila kikkawai TaxID=30033 RepID=A0A6P4IA17_DROKI|nr:uncharacterized protein LOC108072686 [Drosophila kikkawai]
MFAETALIANTQGVTEKRSLTGASNNMRKLLKSFKKIFRNSKVAKETPIPILHTCHTEEEHQNWLNEQLEAKIISLQH